MIKNPYRILLITITVLVILNGIISNNLFCGNMPGSMCWDGSGWRGVLWGFTMILDYVMAVILGALAIHEIYKMTITKLKGKQK